MEKKYLKYKSKYLKLKKTFVQKGGFEIPEYIKEYSHNFLIRCPKKYHKLFYDIYIQRLMKNNNLNSDRFDWSNINSINYEMDTIISFTEEYIANKMIEDLNIDCIQKYTDLLISLSGYDTKLLNLNNNNNNKIRIIDHYLELLEKKSIFYINKFIFDDNNIELLEDFKKNLDSINNENLKLFSDNILIIDNNTDLNHINNKKIIKNYGKNEIINKIPKIKIVYHKINIPFENIIFDKSRVQNLYFGEEFNQQILENSLPKSLIKLYFKKYNRPLGDILSKSDKLQELDFGEIFNEQILENTLPKSLIKLNFGYEFNNNNESLDDVLSNLNKLQELHLSIYNKQILENTLPKSLIKLNFGYEFNNNRESLGDVLSNLNNLQELHFGEIFNQQILKNTLPESLIKLHLGYHFKNNNESLGDVLSNLNNIQELEFGVAFNQQILENTLPRNLIKLTFGTYFNNNRKELDNAFSNLDKLQELEFENMFNQQILENTLPKSLIKLKFGQNFNNGVDVQSKQLLDNSLFNLKNLQELEFGEKFTQEILKNTLPESLIKLKFGKYFNNDRKELDDAFTNLTNLQELEFGNRFNQQILKNTLPESLIKLKFGNKFNNIKEIDDAFFNLDKLQELEFGNDFNQQILKNTLPKSLIKLHLGYHFNNNNESLDDVLSNLDKLQELKFGPFFNQQILENTLPKNLITLDFGSDYDNFARLNNNAKKLGNVLFNLDNLQELKLGDYFNEQILEDTLPKSLIKLKFGKNFNNGVIYNYKISPIQLLNNVLLNLDNLQELEFGQYFNQQILKNTLPESLIKLKFGYSFNNGNIQLDDAFSNLNNLQKIEFGESFNQKILKNTLPKSLKEIILRNRYNLLNNKYSSITIYK